MSYSCLVVFIQTDLPTYHLHLLSTCLLTYIWRTRVMSDQEQTEMLNDIYDRLSTVCMKQCLEGDAQGLGACRNRCISKVDLSRKLDL